MHILLNIADYPFLIYAFVVGGLSALCLSLLGVPLVLKRYSMIGDGLSHVGFGAMSVALALNLAPMYVAVPVVIVAAFLLMRISGNSKINADAAIALISSSAVAIGVLCTSLSGGSNIDIYNYMFGSLLSLSRSDVWFSIAISAAVLVLFVFFYNRVFAMTFDEDFAAATGSKIGIYKSLSALLTAVTVVIGMNLMGTLLVSSLIIFPALTSMRVFRSFRGVVICSAVISLLCAAGGILTSCLVAGASAGASIVVVNLLAFIIFAAFGAVSRRACGHKHRT